MREIIFYTTESGNSPVEEFLDGLPSKETQKVTWVLRLIEELPTIPASYFKKLVHSDDIWEARIVFGGKSVRILGFFDGPALIVLNHAFHKKTQKTPLQAIRIAEQRKREYFARRTKT